MYTQTILKEPVASVSVGICATTERENTGSLADLILGLDDPQIDLQQLIVATPNRQLANDLKERDPRLIVELESGREGKAAAVNRIIQRATGEFLVIASADIKLARNAIPRLVKGLAEHQDWGAVDSRVELVNGERLLMDKVSNVLWDIHNDTLDELDHNGRLGHVAGDLLAIRRDLLDSIPNVINDDSYLAILVQEKGFRVKRVQDALAWISGPRTPADYLFQRSRVLRGHLEMIRRFGKMPSTFEFQVLRRPRRYLGLLVKTVAKLGPSYVIPIVVAGILELVSFQTALFPSLANRPNRPWRLAQTTKQI